MTEPPFLIPSIDRLLGTPAGASLHARYGHAPVVEALRSCTAALRAGAWVPPEPDVTGALLVQAGAMLAREATPSLRPVFNLTGTVLHTNLGRAPLPRAALEGILRVAGTANTLEFDLKVDAGVIAMRTSRRCFASSPAPKQQPWSTTMPRRSCWC
jgi:L-seryl-tRNA(Ser) seleniumtransferase